MKKKKNYKKIKKKWKNLKMLKKLLKEKLKI